MAKNFNLLNLPTDISDMRISDLISSTDAEIHIKNGNVSIRKQTKEGVATFQFNSYSTGRQSSKFSSVPPKRKKLDYLDDILEMYNSGMKQKDIAYELGISPAYVCQISKKYK